MWMWLRVPWRRLRSGDGLEFGVTDVRYFRDPDECSATVEDKMQAGNSPYNSIEQAASAFKALQ